MPGKHQVYFTVTPAEDLILESVQQSNKHEEDVEDDDVERLLLLQPSQMGLNEAAVISGKVHIEKDKDIDDDISIDKEDKINTQLSSNSISPQSTVTQLTVTQLTDDLRQNRFERPSIRTLIADPLDDSLLISTLNTVHKRGNSSRSSFTDISESLDATITMDRGVLVDMTDNNDPNAEMFLSPVDVNEVGSKERVKQSLIINSIQHMIPGSAIKMPKENTFTAILRQKVRNYSCCGNDGWLDFFNKRFPCIYHARNYSYQKFIGDFIAGLTLALTVIPMGIGYAALAGLPLQYGLYASYVPGFMYAIFGTCKEVTIGPTAVNALMTHNYAGNLKTNIVEAALTLGFFSGLIEIGTGILNLGFLTNFISAPVIAAFTSAVSINVMTSQVKGLLGLKKIPGRGFVNTWKAVFQNVTKIRAIDAAIGFTSLGVILLLRNLRNIKCQTSSSENSNNAESNSPMEVFRQRALWFVTVSRNTIVLLFSSLLAYYLIEVKEMKGVIEVTGNVKGGIPPWRLPWEFTNNDSNLHTNDHIVEMNLNNTFEIHTVKEQTTDTLEGPWEVAVGIGSGLVFLPLVSMIQIIAIVHNFSPPTKQLDASQEIFALGMCQLVGSFAGSLPITASFGRSTVNSASGVQTPFGGIITGLIVIAACSFLTPHFAFIPTASLSAVIISSVVLTIDVEILLPIWRSKKVDIIPYLLTLLVGIFVSVEIGMIVGTSVHLAILLYRSSHPEVWIKQKRVEDTPYILVQPDRSLNFPSVDKIRQKLSEASTTYGKELFPENLTSDSEQPHNFPENEETFSSDSSSFTNGKTSIENLAYPVAIIFDLSQVVDIDFSAASLIRALAKSMKEKNGRTLLFCGATQKVEYIMQGVDAAIFLSYCDIEEAEKKLIRA